MLEKLELGNIEKEKNTVNGATGDEQAVNILEYEEEAPAEGANGAAAPQQMLGLPEKEQSKIEIASSQYDDSFIQLDDESVGQGQGQGSVGTAKKVIETSQDSINQQVVVGQLP